MIRTIHAYDPTTDLAERYPLWSIRTIDLHGIGEVIDAHLHTILIDPSYRGEQYAVAHGLAHLDLGHVNPCGSGHFTAQQELDAHWLARVRLDDEADRERA